MSRGIGKFQYSNLCEEVIMDDVGFDEYLAKRAAYKEQMLTQPAAEDYSYKRLLFLIGHRARHGDKELESGERAAEIEQRIKEIRMYRLLDPDAS